MVGSIRSRCNGSLVTWSDSPADTKRLPVQHVPEWSATVEGCREAAAYVKILQREIELDWLMTGDVEAAFNLHNRCDERLLFLFTRSPSNVSIKRLEAIKAAADVFNVQPIKSKFAQGLLVRVEDVTTLDLIAILHGMGSSVTERSLRNIHFEGPDMEEEEDAEEDGFGDMSTRENSTRQFVVRKILRLMGNEPDKAFDEAVSTLWCNLSDEKTHDAAVAQHGAPITSEAVHHTQPRSKAIKEIRSRLKTLLKRSGSTIGDKKWFGTNGPAIMVSFMLYVEQLDEDNGIGGDNLSLKEQAQPERRQMMQRRASEMISWRPLLRVLRPLGSRRRFCLPHLRTSSGHATPSMFRTLQEPSPESPNPSRR
uniref:Uncharacterized protein n=1 Tax=Hemiselmis andersenii TaxID=464988 RepID=A0A6U4T3Q9_HEMAN|mmetsp:Transcript_4336/g.9886  ORF Transcript_4336/g.9886 Transcript_4336/m.9886 type:complete len:367 (-) Transcript_4336:177-1277(-)